jgi:hypothetical protein
VFYKNCKAKTLTFRAGDGPGRVIDYTARPGGFVEGPDGYRKAFKRAGFTPNDELPEEERRPPESSVAARSVPKKRPRNIPDDLQQDHVEVSQSPSRGAVGGGAFDLDDDDDEPATPGGGMATPFGSLDSIPTLPAPPAPVSEPPPPPPSSNVEHQDTAREVESARWGGPPPAEGAQAPASGPGVIPPASGPGPVTERDTKPEKPSNKGGSKK